MSISVQECVTVCTGGCKGNITDGGREGYDAKPVLRRVCTVHYSYECVDTFLSRRFQPLKTKLLNKDI